MIENGKKWIVIANKKHFAIPQFNINNLEWAKAILEEANRLKSPIFLATSEGAVKYMGGFDTVYGITKGLIKDLKIEIPVFLHLDHGSSFESCKNAIDAGYSSVMIDGSSLPIEENLKLTKKVVDYAKKHDVMVEAEVGTVGGEEDGIIGGVKYASLEECLSMADIGINMLAASLGSVHGHYKGEPKLGFEEMKLYSEKTKLPLVLHGGSGIPDFQIKKAIEMGESKININTEIQEAYAKGIRKYIEEKKDLTGKGFDPRKLIGTYAYPNMKKIVEEKILLFGSNNRI